eukprot:s6291_g1.t1
MAERGKVLLLLRSVVQLVVVRSSYGSCRGVGSDGDSADTSISASCSSGGVKHAHHLHTETFTVLQSMVCVRNGTEVRMMKENASMPLGSDPLLRIIQKDGLFWVDKASPNTASKKLWRVVRDGQPSGHILTEGDIIKLGRFKFKVRQLGMNPASQPELRLEDTGGACCPAHLDHEALAWGRQELRRGLVYG